ncbi:unnamed protein product [Didymodactylos carnosus]|uniref:Uncharacterized protein n=1 Tax=Didymodactylos carnosus TaxID=1234261 RepID=A0A814WVS8_9BILA|nr:unnamed protein product [Didymodactylos carnosus]CAF1259454.1 unnamed protein product [Didymodactylos carnosus]CAF3971104.1 unnamed protein product [Didymodactylos carnosus]CAF4066300.1 unnamed protein product [Didymodactylos carnosus]
MKLLCRGWKFCVGNKVTKTLDLKTDIEHGMYHIKELNKERKSIKWELLYDDVKIKAQNLLYQVSHKRISNLSKSEIDAMRKLENDKTIVLLKADKGNAIVIMNKKDYYSKVIDMLDEPKKFSSSLVDDTLAEENKINNRLKQLKEKKIDQKTYDRIFVSGCTISYLY